LAVRDSAVSADEVDDGDGDEDEEEEAEDDDDDAAVRDFDLVLEDAVTKQEFMQD
jgi:hypothetical protein